MTPMAAVTAAPCLFLHRARCAMASHKCMSLQMILWDVVLLSICSPEVDTCPFAACFAQLVQIRKQGADWVKAAKSFLQRQGIIDGLFQQYAALKDLATDYATKVSSSTWRKDQGHLGSEVSRQALWHSCVSCVEWSWHLSRCSCMCGRLRGMCCLCTCHVISKWHLGSYLYASEIVCSWRFTKWYCALPAEQKQLSDSSW